MPGLFPNDKRNKDWDWLKENLVPFQMINNWDIDKYCYYDAQNVINNHKSKDRIHRDDLRIIYNNIFQTSKNASEFTRLCNLNGLSIKPIKINDITQQGFFWK